MKQAIWNDTILASSDDTVVVENNHYFPPASLAHEHFRESSHTTVCPWKGTAHYYDVLVGVDAHLKLTRAARLKLTHPL